MGDISAEPSMEEILSSIKRIIAEEGEAPGRPRRAPRTPTPPAEPIGEDDDAPESVLELDQPIAAPRAPAAPAPAPRPAPVAAPAPPPPAAPAPEPAAERIVSRQTVEATRGSLDTLSRLLVKPETGSDGTLEGLVREMLRPMLREWLDANLPPLVQAMVAGEIAKITGHRD